MSLRSPLGRVLGQGAARAGVRHWWQQRLTSLALVPLTVWLVVSLLTLPSLGHATLIAWMSQSWTALLLILLVLVAAWHSQLGVRVVIEDYVHGSGARTPSCECHAATSTSRMSSSAVQLWLIHAMSVA